MTFTLNNTEISRRLKSGMRYLFNSIRSDGSFVYEINSATGVVSGDYNMLRHAGCLYVMCQWLNETQQKAQLANLGPAFDFLSNLIKKLKNDTHLYALVEKNKVKLGGAALTLLAFIEKYKLEPLDSDLKLMQSLATFIIWMQEPSGKFRSKLYYKKANFSDFESTYYPGQAILALTLLYKLDKNSLWLKHAASGIEYLLLNPVIKSNGRYGHNHWLVLALVEYYHINSVEAVYNGIWLITNDTLNSTETNRQNIQNQYTYSTAAIATRAEAFSAVLCLELKLKSYNRIDYLNDTLHNIIDYCFQFQIDEDIVFDGINLKGGIQGGTDDYNIRIDYVQHLLQALLIIKKSDVEKGLL